jgi:hypothetical protein
MPAASTLVGTCPGDVVEFLKKNLQNEGGIANPSKLRKFSDATQPYIRLGEMIPKGTLLQFLQSHADIFEVLPLPEGQKGFQYRLRDAPGTAAADVLPGSASKESASITAADARCKAKQTPPLPLPLSRPIMDNASFYAMLRRQQTNFSWPKPPTVPGQSSSSGSPVAEVVPGSASIHAAATPAAEVVPGPASIETAGTVCSLCIHTACDGYGKEWPHRDEVRLDIEMSNKVDADKLEHIAQTMDDTLFRTDKNGWADTWVFCPLTETLSIIYS